VHSVGVQRQYTGTTGCIEDAQVAVYLTYAAPRGHAFIDRALYLPKSWTSDPNRCAVAGVPDDTNVATKPALAAAMITRAVGAGVPAGWVAVDEVYGDDPRLRATIRGLGLGCVLQVARPTPAVAASKPHVCCRGRQAKQHADTPVTCSRGDVSHLEGELLVQADVAARSCERGGGRSTLGRVQRARGSARSQV
jgi:SRSO17 transposase